MPNARIPLTFDIQSRTASTVKDSKIVNAIVEGEEIVKRPGLAALPLVPALPTGQGQGLYSWHNYLIAGDANSIYSIIPNSGVTANLGTIVGTPLPLSFTPIVNDTYLVFHNGANLYLIDKATNTLTSPLSGGGVISATVNSSGGYYASAPAVTFSGGAPAATGHSVLFNNSVASVVVDTPGTYTPGVVPTVTIAAPAGGTQATIHTQYFNVFSYSEIHAVSVTGGGSGYTTAPIVTFPIPSSGHTATGYAVINGAGVVTSIVVTYGGVYALSNTTQATIAAPTGGTALATTNMSSTLTGPYAAGIVYLDQRVYIMQKNTGTIYGSDQNDPTTWNVLNAIVAGGDPDEMVGIARHLNYIVAFGLFGIEFFYDAGPGAGAPPASLLAPNHSAYLEIGCANGYSIAKAEQTLLWVGTSSTEGRSVYLLEGVSPVKVSNRYIDKYLNKASMDTMTDGSSSVRAYCLKISGHTLYILTMKDLALTFVFDLDEKKWYQWTSQSAGTETFFSPTSFDGNIEYNPGLYLQDEASGSIYQMSADYYNDAGNSIFLRAVSPLLDSGTTKRKFYQRVEVVGDKINGNATIRHSDDDYSTWSTYRTVNLGDSRPVLYQHGSARRRAWELLITDDIPVRLTALEMDFDLGEQGGGQEG